MMSDGRMHIPAAFIVQNRRVLISTGFYPLAINHTIYSAHWSVGLSEVRAFTQNKAVHNTETFEKPDDFRQRPICLLI